MANLARGRKDGPLANRPNDVFSVLQREMNKVFDRFAGPFELLPGRAFDIAAAVDPEAEIKWRPKVNVEDRDNDILITLEAPGVEKDDIEITTDEDSVTIRGHKQQETEQKQRNYYNYERSFGSFERTIPLPMEVDSEKADATFKNGVLKICLPKSEKAKQSVKKISIQGQPEARSAQATTAPKTEQAQPESPAQPAEKPKQEFKSDKP